MICSPNCRLREKSPPPRLTMCDFAENILSLHTYRYFKICNYLLNSKTR